jgi:hypothetical protein
VARRGFARSPISRERLKLAEGRPRHGADRRAFRGFGLATYQPSVLRRQRSSTIRADDLPVEGLPVPFRQVISGGNHADVTSARSSSSEITNS